MKWGLPAWADVLAAGLCDILTLKILFRSVCFSPIAVNVGNSGGVGESSSWDGGAFSGTLRKLLQGEPVPPLAVYANLSSSIYSNVYKNR